MISKELFKKWIENQRELDAKILGNMHIAKVPIERIELAYRIELAECVNELKGAVKYWSTKTPEMENLIEEYVDAFHFVLSYSYRYADANANRFKYRENEDRIDYMYRKILNRINERRDRIEMRYGPRLSIWQIANFAIKQKTTIGSFAYLSIMIERMGVTDEQIFEAYRHKLAVNHGRSDSGTY